MAMTASQGAHISAAPGDASVTPGEFTVEHPTLNNLGFEWRIDGDANRNASVDVSFRKVGESAWRKGLPLARIQNEHLYQRNVFDLVAPNMFAGSILDLEPGTDYEARFVLTDADGVTGPAANATKTVTVHTRPEPKPAEGGKTYHVYPVKWKGPKTEPAFEGIMCAVQLLLRRGRHGAGRAAAREAGRRHPRARRHVRLSLGVLRQPDHRQRDHDVRGHLLPDGGRDA
jgi:hypothetical protein